MKKSQKILDDVYSYRNSIVVLTAVSTGLFDMFVEMGRLTVKDVSSALNWSKRGTEIFLQALCGLGYLQREKDVFRLAEKHKTVISPENYPLEKQWLLHEWNLMNRWLHLPEVLQTGAPYREPEKTGTHRDHENFMLAMASRERTIAPGLVNSVSLDGFMHLLDLGGGPGLFAIAFAEKYPDLRATVFDNMESEPVARRFFEDSPARERLFFKAGDFMTDPLGDGYDVALLSSILHIYGPKENRILLQKVFNALKPGGKVLVRDFLLYEKKTGPKIATLFGINMLVNTRRGNAYSSGEIKSWLKEAGFVRIKKRKLQAKMELLEAAKPAADKTGIY